MALDLGPEFSRAFDWIYGWELFLGTIFEKKVREMDVKGLKAWPN